NGSLRVKGIIKVSRTIGDAYLKRPEFMLHESFPKFKKVPKPCTSGVPSAEPEMFTRVLTENDKFLIFASVGLWEFLSNEQAAEIVQKNPRNGVAKRLLNSALAEAANRRNVTYMDIQAAALGHDNMSRRSFHDDISVIVLFLAKKLFLRRRVHNLSYICSFDTPLPSDFARSGLIASRLKDCIKKRFKLGSLHASSSQIQGPRTPLAQNTQTPVVEGSQTQRRLGQSSQAQSR
ncbi:probable protein phosphatase 2C 25, partial [Medicago truncatula]|uniref:probable protein phosphatase 2C 25 n=1 Tax=Medicago truncatula TaxID=3880 RepID=UPI000D2F43D6